MGDEWKIELDRSLPIGRYSDKARAAQAHNKEHYRHAQGRDAHTKRASENFIIKEVCKQDAECGFCDKDRHHKHRELTVLIEKSLFDAPERDCRVSPYGQREHRDIDRLEPEQRRDRHYENKHQREENQPDYRAQTRER